MKPAATAGRRRPHWHAPEKGTGPAFVLSLLAHALLFLSIAFVVRWKTEPAGSVSAELWGGSPIATVQPAPSPPKVEPAPEPPKAEPAPEPPKVEPKPEPPPPKVEPKPEPEREADIALAQKKEKELEAKRLEAQKREAEKREAEKREAERRETLKREAEQREAAKREAERRERLAAEKKAAEKAAAEKAAAEKRREQELQRIAAAAGPGNPGATGTVGATGVSGGFSRSYEGQVVGCIRPHIVFNVPENVRPKQFVTEYEVQLLPTGEQAGAPRLLKASGLAAYDQAVERAIRRCDPFPRPREGAMPRSLRLTFDPVDTR